MAPELPPMWAPFPEGPGKEHILLMEEIRLTTWHIWNLVDNGINYQPQLVQDFFHRQYESKGNKSVLKSKQYPVPTGMPADTLPGAVMRSIIKGSNVFCHGYEDQRCVSSFVLSLRINVTCVFLPWSCSFSKKHPEFIWQNGTFGGWGCDFRLEGWIFPGWFVGTNCSGLF